MLRLIWQAGDQEQEPVRSPENTGQSTGTPLQYEVSSLSLAKATQGTLVRSVLTLSTLETTEMV